MEVIKILVNGIPQGIYGITKKEEVTDIFLDMSNDENQDKLILKNILDSHIENGFAIIPKDEKPFDWNEDLHGVFFSK